MLIFSVAGLGAAGKCMPGGGHRQKSTFILCRYTGRLGLTLGHWARVWRNIHDVQDVTASHVKILSHTQLQAEWDVLGMYPVVAVHMALIPNTRELVLFCYL
jgi:hypothetical protein